MKKELIVITNVSIDDEPQFDLEHFCFITNATPDVIHEMVVEGIIDPEGEFFTVKDLQRVRKTQHLQRDLGVNIAGAALVMDLIDELEELRERVKLMERFVQR